MTAPCRDIGHPVRDNTVFDLMPGRCARSCNRQMQAITQYCGISLLHCSAAENMRVNEAPKQ
jgi:hypothetical protein